MKKNVRSLRGIKPEATQSRNATASATPTQDQAESILGQAGAVLAELPHRIPNLNANQLAAQSCALGG